MTEFRKFVNNMNRYGFATHASILYLMSGIFIYLPTGLLLNFKIFKKQNLEASDLASYMTQWYMVGSFVGGWILYMAFAFGYFKVSVLYFFQKHTNAKILLIGIIKRIYRYMKNYLLFQFGHQLKFFRNLLLKNRKPVAYED